MTQQVTPAMEAEARERYIQCEKHKLWHDVERPCFHCLVSEVENQ